MRSAQWCPLDTPDDDNGDHHHNVEDDGDHHHNVGGDHHDQLEAGAKGALETSMATEVEFSSVSPRLSLPAKLNINCHF